MNPLPPLIGLIAIAVGVYGGLQLGAWAAPDLAPAETEITTEEAQPEPITGDDPDSLFRPGPLSEQLNLALKDVPEGATVSYVGINADRFYFNKVRGPNVLPLADLPVRAPERILVGINQIREDKGKDPVTFDDVASFGWSTANPTEIEWSADLDSSAPGPTTFSADRDGANVVIR